MLAQLEQEALDHGSALLSQEFSLEPAPPFTSFQQHQIPGPTEMPYTKLLRPTWVEACAHRLKEIDSYTEMRKKLGQKPKASTSTNPPSSSQAKGGAKAMHGMYRSVKLEAHPGKGFTDQVEATFWGATINGAEGWIRPSIPRSASLAWICSRVARMGVCSVGLLEVLAGGFVAIFSFRRRMMSLLDLVYACQAGRDRRDVIRLSPELIDELWSLAVLCPLAVTNLRAQYSPDIFMVDASNWGEAVVEAPLDGGMAEEIHRHGLSRSSGPKLLSPYKAALRAKGALSVEEELPEGESCYSEHPVWEVAARGLQYKESWKQRCKRERHINIGEVRAYLKAEDIAASRNGDVRVAIGGDSQVSAGCICKGRSASSVLNRELRKSLGTVLGSGVYSCPGFVRSAHNPADDPTRGKQLRDADVFLPTWWHDAVSNNFVGIDQLLDDEGLSNFDIGGYPALNELDVKNPALVDPVCKSKLKRMHLKARSKLRLKAQQREASTKSQPADIIPSPWPEDVTKVLDSFDKSLFILSRDCHWPPRVPGFLDLYSGQKGFAKSAVRQGCPWVLTIDIKDGPHCDLLKNEFRNKISFLLRNHVFKHVSAAPICSSFSRAITPAVRSRDFRKGLKHVYGTMLEKIRDGNSHSVWLASLILICISLDIHYWVENPHGSFLWLQPEWMSLPCNRSSWYFTVDYCTYKTPWRKRTRFLTSGGLKFRKQLCDRSHSHVILRGKDKKSGRNMTQIAEPYPRALCALLAWHACKDVGCLRRSLICRSNHMRIGEAKNPGPRRPRHEARSGDALDSVQLISAQTSALGERLYSQFQRWLVEHLDSSGIDQLFLVPSLMGYMLASYGRYLYSRGDALYTFRHLVVYIQRELVGSRGFLVPAWEVIARWEELEPVEHRRPLPAAMVGAMVCLSISWGWLRISSVILIAFHGCCRPGEVLRAQRSQLVLPCDLGLLSGPNYLRIQKPKPGRRGVGRVQHAKIADDNVVAFLTSAMKEISSDSLLYPGTSSAFRLRWNKLLYALSIPTTAQLTPAGLRAGGTVELYRRGTPVMDILWALRLKNVETLQHYLQEIATQITMVDLPLDARSKIACLQSLHSLLPYFLRSSSFVAG
eukprot:Skav205630  [mRNA]  locus=scaffold1575:126668:131720:+ [translate_table: standard]